MRGEEHGIRVIGFWGPVVATSNVLNYLLAFEDLAHRERAWAAFTSDKEWQRIRDETQRDGPIVACIRNEIWQPTPYSPLPRPKAEDGPVRSLPSRRRAACQASRGPCNGTLGARARVDGQLPLP